MSEDPHFESTGFNAPISDKEIANFKRNLLSSLPPTEARIYQFLVQKLGNSRVPKDVPLIVIGKALDLSYMKAWRGLDALCKKGLIDKITTTHGEGPGDTSSGHFRKTTYLRLHQQTLF
jgi:hypothetical protein